ncbi:MAG: LytTR family DNA-binding domain-containing protein [Cyclobacteriaceae bacterium]
MILRQINKKFAAVGAETGVLYLKDKKTGVKILTSETHTFHLQRAIGQLILAAIVLYGLIGRFSELSELYFIMLGVSFLAIMISTLIVLRYGSQKLFYSLLINLSAGGIFFIAGNLLSDYLIYEIIESVSMENEGNDQSATVVAARVYEYSGWEFLWVFLIHTALAYLPFPASNSKLEVSISDFSDEVFKVKLGNKLHFLPYREIEWIEASGNYIHIYSGDKKYTSRMAIQDILTQANKEYLMRIHRSFAINVHFLRELTQTGEGHSVVLTNGKELKIGKHYKADLFRHLGLTRM